ncbi:MAG TPA: succinyldiaminopimelate transaminase [Thiolapillus brandeum]|uniref:Succinyldiaminopimelate transaminase n=1 Tax=Thiolapillus brandeum TaxID=1076588 RepID=A0A831RT50_9GAMM|nr:succinyldiaminopimelate transaminase [Thiolapillus brandeum]
MNSDLQKLQPYPFEKLRLLKEGCHPPVALDHIALSIGEPRHPTPAFITEAVLSHLHGLSAYPLTKGAPELRETICSWLSTRFQLPKDNLDPEHHVLPVNGTREALFAFAQTIVDRSQPNPLVLMPNPFYQIYEGAAFLAGARPEFLNCTEDTSLMPDFDAVDAKTWDDCQLLYLCSPHNPTGAVIPETTLAQLMELAHRHDFVIAADECYSEIYFDEDKPPVGLLQAAANAGNDSYSRCVVFHSLSKRSNAPGLRSGFVAGDREILGQFLRYRTYHGCAMPPHHQAASIMAWQDEKHVEESRRAYQEKFAAVLGILDGQLTVRQPEAGFYLWAQTPGSDTEFARQLFDRQNVTVLPGSYLSREADGINPGADHVRMALVAPMDECIDAANRIRQLIESYY